MFCHEMNCYSWIRWSAFFISVVVATYSRVRNVDVVVIGGGVSGTYAAVRLHDQQKSIALIEARDCLGGNTETYVDPATNTPIDIGVEIFKNYSTVRDYYARFNISLTKADLTVPGTMKFLDFSTGKLVSSPRLSNTPEAEAAGFAAYILQRAKYPYLSNGYHVPDPIPPDLLLPFGHFVEKYNLSATLPIISLFCEGFGDLATVPSLYILRYIDAEFLNYVFTNSFITTTAHHNSLLYSAAGSLLGSSVLLRSRVLSVSRPTHGRASLSVLTSTGVISIHAKRILAAFPQTLSNFDGWDLDDATERSLFSKFHSTGWYTGLLRNTDIPTNLTLQNAGTDTVFNLPSLPSVYNIGPSPVQGLLNVKYGNIANYSLVDVETAVIGCIERLRRYGVIPSGGKVQVPILRSHTPYALRVSVPDIQARFYDRLYALQGYRGTYYTGAAFQRHDASTLWQYTDVVLKNLTQGLRMVTEVR